MLMTFFDTYSREHRPYKGGPWCYEDGLVYRGLELLHQATGQQRWLDHLNGMVEQQLDAGPALKGYDPNDYNIDNIMSGRALLYLEEVTGESRYLDAAKLLADQLQTHPRTRSGVYWHKLRYPWQVWLDGLYMGPPFQIGYGLRTGRDGLVEDALDQVETAMEMTYVPTTRLYAHAVDEARKQPWADAQTGHSRAHWARAIGWLAMALVDIAELVGPERFAPLSRSTSALLSEVTRLIRPSGLWLQVIDQPDLQGNFEETSASAMFVYALLKAKQLGLWKGSTTSLMDQLVKASIKPKRDGHEMVGICHVAGLGMYQGRFRDGSAGYYLSETSVCDDTKGVGPLMMAAATALNLASPEASARAMG